MTLPDSPRFKENRASFQQTVRTAIQERGVTNDELAEKLGLLPIGAEVLMAQSDWSLDVTYRVAEVIGLEVHMSVEPRE